MDIHVLKNYFLKLGASFYNSDDYRLKGYSYNPIGNYGIGFLACFMLSNEVKVKTRHMNDSNVYEVDINKFDEFVCINHNTGLQNQGIEVILKYDQFMEIWEAPENIEEFLNTHFLTDEINIQYINKMEEEIKDINNCIFDHSLENGVNFSEYLNGIEGMVSLNRDINYIFKNSIEGLNYWGIPLVFDGMKLYALDQHQGMFDLTDFIIKDNKMSVLNFPVIEDGEDLDKIIDAVGAEDAMGIYIDRKNVNYITIIAEDYLMEEYKEGFVDEGTEILPNLYLNEFSDYGHDPDSRTVIEYEEKLIYHINNHSLFLPIKQPESTFKINGIDFDLFAPKKEFNLFVRNVFVEKFNLDVPYKLCNLSIKNLTVNIINNDVKPNVTRNII